MDAAYFHDVNNILSESADGVTGLRSDSSSSQHPGSQRTRKLDADTKVTAPSDELASLYTSSSSSASSDSRLKNESNEHIRSVRSLLGGQDMKNSIEELEAQSIISLKFSNNSNETQLASKRGFVELVDVWKYRVLVGPVLYLGLTTQPCALPVKQMSSEYAASTERESTEDLVLRTTVVLSFNSSHFASVCAFVFTLYTNFEITAGC